MPASMFSLVGLRLQELANKKRDALLQTQLKAQRLRPFFGSHAWIDAESEVYTRPTGRDKDAPVDEQGAFCGSET